MPRIGSRGIDAPEYAGGKRRTVLLPKQNLVFAYLATLAGTFNVTGGTAAGSVYADAMHRMFERVTLRGDGRDMISCRGRALGRIRKFFYNEEDFQDPPSNDTAGLSEAIEANLFIPTHMPRSYNEFAALLPSYAIDAPTLLIDWADAADALSGEDATAVAIADGALTLTEYPVGGLPLANPKALYGVPLIRDIEYSVVAAESARKIYLDHLSPGEELRAVLIETDDNDAPSDALIEQFRLNINGVDELENTTWNAQRNRNKVTYGLATRESGAIVLDSAEDERTGPGEMWTVFEGPRPFLEVKTAAPTSGAKIWITTLSVKRG